MRCRKMLLMLLFMMMSLFAVADDIGEPCGGEDPYDEECPLDSWVYLLVLTPVTVAFVGVFLRSEALKEEAKIKGEDKNVTINNAAGMAIPISDAALPMGDCHIAEGGMVGGSSHVSFDPATYGVFP